MFLSEPILNKSERFWLTGPKENLFTKKILQKNCDPLNWIWNWSFWINKNFQICSTPFFLSKSCQIYLKRNSKGSRIRGWWGNLMTFVMIYLLTEISTNSTLTSLKPGRGLSWVCGTHRARAFHPLAAKRESVFLAVLWLVLEVIVQSLFPGLQQLSIAIDNRTFERVVSSSCCEIIMWALHVVSS